MLSRHYLEFKREEPDCLWITPLDGSVDFRQPEAVPELRALQEEFEQSGVSRVVIDLSLLPYFGSTLLEWLIIFWKRVRERNGAMALFGPTQIGLDVLKVVRFDVLLPIADSREEALRMVREPCGDPAR